MAGDKEKQAGSKKDKDFDKSSSLEPTESHALNDKGNSRISSFGWKTLAILGSSILITMYGETMLLPAIPDIIKEFNISYSTSSWILTSYLIAGAVATPIGGKLSDIYGRKKMVLIIMIIYIIGISLGGLASDITILIISRIIQGVGIAMFPIAFGIVRDQFPPEKLAIGIGTFSAMFAAGSVVGLAIGGTIIQNFGWRVTFFSIIPVSFMLWFVIKKFIYDTQYRPPSLEFSSSVKAGTSADADVLEHNIQGSTNVPNTHIPSKSPDVKVVNVKSFTQSIDIKGAITLAITITSFLIVLSYMDTGISHNDIGSDQILGRDDVTSYTAPSQIVIGFLSVGIISLTIFIITERKANTPLIDIKLIANRIILASNILLLISFLSMFTVYQTIPFLVRSPVAVGGFGGDPIATANIQLPFMVVFLVFAPFSGFIISKLGKIKPTFIGSVIAAFGFFSIFIMHSTPAFVAGALAIIATGLSLIQVGAFNIVLESTPRHLSGTSLGTTVLFNLIGGAVGPAIAGIIMQTNQISIAGSNDTVSSFPSPQSYYLIFLITAILSLVSIILVLIVKKTTTMKVA
jgi:MFS family permease